MARVTIRVDTIDAGNVEVEESNSRRTYGQSDAEFIADLLDKAVAKIRAAYGIECDGPQDHLDAIQVITASHGQPSSGSESPS